MSYFCRWCFKFCDKDDINFLKEKVFIVLDVIRMSVMSMLRFIILNGWFMFFFYIVDVSFIDSSILFFMQLKLVEVNFVVLINCLCVRYGVNVLFVVNFCVWLKSSKIIDVGGMNVFLWCEILDLSEYQCFL